MLNILQATTPPFPQPTRQIELSSQCLHQHGTETDDVSRASAETESGMKSVFENIFLYKYSMNIKMA